MENPWYVRVPLPEVGGRQAVADRFPICPFQLACFGSSHFWPFPAIWKLSFGVLWWILAPPPGWRWLAPPGVRLYKIVILNCVFPVFFPHLFVANGLLFICRINERTQNRLLNAYIPCLQCSRRTRDWLDLLPPLRFRWHRRRGVYGGR